MIFNEAYYDILEAFVLAQISNTTITQPVQLNSEPPVLKAVDDEFPLNIHSQISWIALRMRQAQRSR
jgi:hypothetical protein